MNLEEFTRQFNWWAPNKNLHLGVESELWLVSASGELVPLALDVLKLAAYTYLPTLLKDWTFKDGVLTAESELALRMIREKLSFQEELPLAQIEIQTEPTVNVDGIRDMLEHQRARLYKLVRQLGYYLLPFGSPVIGCALSIFPSKKYYATAQRFGDRIADGFIAGTHVHVGVMNQSVAMRVYNLMREYLPVLLALSANSPFEKGVYAGVHSSRYFHYRSLIEDALPRTIESWEEYFERVQRMGQNYQLLRLHQNGTVEVRVGDAMTTIAETTRYAALVKLVAVVAARTNYEVLPLSDDELERELEAAARFGFSYDAPRAYRDKWRNRIAELRRYVEPFRDATERLDEIIRHTNEGQTGSMRQIAIASKEAPDLARLVEETDRAIKEEVGAYLPFI